MGTPSSSIPVGRLHFDANMPEEVAVYTIVGGSGGLDDRHHETAGVRTVTFGQVGDVPVPGDYDAVGFDQIAVYRPSTGQFLVDNGGTTQTITIPGIGVGTPDLSSLVPVPGQYDNTAYYNASTLKGHNTPILGHTEAAVFDALTGAYTILGPSGVYSG